MNVEIGKLENIIDRNAIKPLTEDIKKADYASGEWETTLRRLAVRLQDTKSLGQQSLISSSLTNGFSNQTVNKKAKRIGFSEGDLQSPYIQDNEAIREQIKLMEQQAATVTNLVAPAFDGLFAAFANGTNIGEALLQSFKQIALELLKLVARALIFKAILSALKLSNPLTAGVDLFGGNGGAIGGGLNIIGLLRGNDIALALDRTNTSYGYRRGG